MTPLFNGWTLPLTRLCVLLDFVKVLVCFCLAEAIAVAGQPGTAFLVLSAGALTLIGHLLEPGLQGASHQTFLVFYAVTGKKITSSTALYVML
jgi:hypothetical protein